MRLRISQFCARHGICSRHEAKKLIQSGQLKLNGKVLEQDSPVKPSLDPCCITFDQRLMRSEACKVTVILHKPEGYLSTFTRRTELWAKALLVPGNRCETDTQNQLNPSRLRRLVPINPLEYSASGLALYSEETSLITRFADCEEEYHVVFRDPITQPKLYTLRSDIYIDGVEIPPLEVKQLSDYSAAISIRGASSKLRKACRLAGLDIRSIKRLRMGNVSLGDLMCGQWMLLRRYQLT